MLGDTIVALSSPPGASARAVVRLSGPDAHALARALFPALPAGRGGRARGGRFAAGALALPGWPPAPAEAVAFHGPRSYTGEDVVELWVPGAPPLVARLLRALQAAGARLADRGEFTRRAFLAGRLDLTQAEAVLALTTSEDALLARAALRALAGGARPPLDAAKEALLGVLAHLEAAIDFSEEELDLAAPADLAARIAAADAALAGLQRACGRRLAGAGHPVVALRGPANAGKSSLWNALARRAGAAALVSAQAGTTRDVLAAEWHVAGLGPVTLLDTAGGKEPADRIERLALAAAAEAEQGADLVLVVVDGREPLAATPFLARGEEARPTLLVLNKRDLGAPAPLPEGRWPGGLAPLEVSARTGAGLSALAAAVARALGSGGAAPDLLGSARQDEQLRRARAALARAAALIASREPARAELAAADLGEALAAIGALTGAVTTEDVLDRLFGSFCVGK